MSIASRFLLAPMLIVIAWAVFSPRSASAQTTTDLIFDPWPTDAFYTSFDNPVLETRSHLRDSSSGASVFWYDSYGRARLGTHDDNAVDIGYHWISIDFATVDPRIPKHVDEIGAALGLHLGEVGGGKVSVIFGAGFSGNNLFVDSRGVFGIAHFIWDRPVNDTDSVVATLDYDRSNALLPDIPLPGVEYKHHDDKMDWEVGFPDLRFRYDFDEHVIFNAKYSVPYTADVNFEFPLIPGDTALSAFVGYSNYYHGFQIEHAGDTRTFFQMQRVEMGLRVIHGTLIDLSVGGGYGFDQHFASGWDVRGLSNIVSLGDRPYLFLTLRGQF